MIEVSGREHRQTVMTTQNPVADLMKLISGFQISQSISVAAALGIADILKNDVLQNDAIAKVAGCHPRSLFRLLHALASAGVLEERPGQNFKLTPIGECLRSDSPTSRSAWARYVGRPYVWQSWGDLLHSVKTGESAFGHLHSENLWKWRGERPEETEIFDTAMSELSRSGGKAIATAYDFAAFNVIVDLGGGQGALLAAILAKNATSRGILLDLPHVVVKAKDVLQTAGVADRCEVIGGDVFKSVPKGGDAYLIKSVLMDEDDDQAVAILKACRSGMASSAKVIVIEHLLAAPNQPEIHFSDMTMMVMTGGRERTAEEFAALFSAAGFRLEQIVSTQSPFTLIVGVPI
jgi:predicted O-methyltransferase YrrM